MILEFQPSIRACQAGRQPIADLMAQALNHPHLISLAAGFVDQSTLPVRETRLALESLMSDPIRFQKALQYGVTPGDESLRELIMERTVAADRCGGIERDQVIVTTGSNQLLHLVAESLLDPGDIVLCAAPTYLVFLGVLGNLGARAVGVQSDDDGIIPEAIEATLSALSEQGDLARVKAIYLVSYSDNPAGVTMPAARREAVVRIAKQWSRETAIHVIDDCAYRELRYEGEDIPGIRVFDEDRDTVITAGTFSKSFSPGIRIGWGILPDHLVEPVCSQKANIDFGSPNINQQLIAEVLRQGLHEQHVAQLRLEYATKMSAMLTGLEEAFGRLPDVHWHPPGGGLYVWLTLSKDIDTGPDGPLFDVAVENGVLYVPGQFCYPEEGVAVQRNTIRLSFGVQPPDRITAGIHLLAKSVMEVEHR